VGVVNLHVLDSTIENGLHVYPFKRGLKTV
jgi:hypothetical protein